MNMCVVKEFKYEGVNHVPSLPLGYLLVKRENEAKESVIVMRNEVVENAAVL